MTDFMILKVLLYIYVAVMVLATMAFLAFSSLMSPEGYLTRLLEWWDRK